MTVIMFIVGWVIVGFIAAVAFGQLCKNGK